MKKAKTTTVAKPAKPAKLPAPVAQRLQHQITSLQHQVTSLKHRQGGTAKHKAKATTKHSRARKWSPDEDVALCSARAVAEAVRLSSGIVLSDQDVLTLHWQAGGSENAGASILGALEASGEFLSEVLFDDVADVLAEVLLDGVHGRCLPDARLDLNHPLAAVPAVGDERGSVVVQGEPHLHTPIILGLDLPYGEPHAVTVDIDGTWWSWGQPHTAADFPGAVIDEAWAVQWQ